MCGIFGILSSLSNISILDSVSMLRRLEYRGYDSAGMMFLSTDKKPEVIKKKGKIQELENSISHSNFNNQKTNFLMSHTRWATHGEPNDTNSHPHISLGKKNNVAIARKCAQLGREILGGNGIMDDYPMMRHMMNLETVYTYEGTHEIHTLILGQKITDIPAFE